MTERTPPRGDHRQARPTARTTGRSTGRSVGRGSRPAARAAAPATRPTRTLVLWCHDWPVVAAGIPLTEPAVVLHGNTVLVCSPAARDEGIVEGARRREAQSRCPEVAVVHHDPGRDARAFEPVVAALEALTPRIQITRPGSCAFATRGPSRYFGGDDALAERARQVVAEVLDPQHHFGHFGVGLADGLFAAQLAARSRSAGQPPLVVPPGGSPSFLAPFPVATLDLPAFTDVLRRLGPRTLGDLAALPAGHLTGRFGETGRRAHRLAQGLDPRVPQPRIPPLDLTTSIELDPPADRVDTIAFTAKVLADDLHSQLARRGLGCTGLQVTAETENGEPSDRYWTAPDPLSPAAMAERVRWQLEGWLGGSAAHRPTAGITLLRLTPTELVPAKGRQLRLWGEPDDDDVRPRALARLEGLLGSEAVTVIRPGGGRGAGEAWVRVPTVSAVNHPHEPPPPVAAHPRDSRPPWPGRIPTPLPALLAEADPATTVEVVDEQGHPVGVTSRGMLTGEPARLVVGPDAGNRPGPRPESGSGAGSVPGQLTITSWAGPWPVDERWWAPATRHRSARFQVITHQGSALLLTLVQGRWRVEATYD